MRIISGFLKGKKINFLKNANTRPLKDAVKENIFNILKHSNLINVKIEQSNILDLYSGFGSFGLECISRGSKKVTFVEQDFKAANILKENLIKLSILNKALVANHKIENVLENFKKNRFSIFFLDPPFIKTDFLQTLRTIKEKKLFKKNHIVIIHREKKTQDNLENIINVLFIKQYGRSKIIFGFFN
jgi:16S rRNA (guanine966-N2)-methyltransferase